MTAPGAERSQEPWQDPCVSPRLKEKPREEVAMPRLISELIVSLDMKARGLKSPGYYGYMGPEFQSWLNTNNAEPHRTLIGRKTYELVNALPDAAKDEGWHRAT